MILRVGWTLLEGALDCHCVNWDHTCGCVLLGTPGAGTPKIVSLTCLVHQPVAKATAGTQGGTSCLAYAS